MQIHDKKLNSGDESFPPSLIFPKGETIKKKAMKVKDNIETVNKVSNRPTTNFLLLERKLFEASGNINTRQEKRIANPELIKKTGKLTSKPKNFAFLGPINEVEALFKFLFI
tara:strand:+ start:304 stop:639 length:336 start_codon:yes stop_codon:yes gene_type:complete